MDDHGEELIRVRSGASVGGGSEPGAGSGAPRRSSWGARAVARAVVLAAVVVGCGGEASEAVADGAGAAVRTSQRDGLGVERRNGAPPGPEASALAGAAASLDALGRGALRAVARGDTAGLRRLRVSREEHRDVIWPELPESEPSLHVPWDFVWANLERRNSAALARILPRYDGWSVAYRGTDCPGDVHTFATFRVLTGCRVRVEDPEGRSLVVPLFEDAVERGGGWKLFRYYDHRPRIVASPRDGGDG